MNADRTLTPQQIEDAAAVLAALSAIPHERRLDALAVACSAWCQSAEIRDTP